MSIKEKDHIVRLLEQFYLALAKFLYGNTKKENSFENFEEKSSPFFLISSTNDIIKYFQQSFP
ncbi:MAG: hypothetical protein ACK5L7_07100 [Paludibacteraceae bacterium]